MRPALGIDLRQLNDPWQGARCLQNGQIQIPPERILAGQRDDEIQRLVEDARKGMRGIETDRAENRQQFIREVAP